MMGAAWLVSQAVFLAKGILYCAFQSPRLLSRGDFFGWMNGQGANH